MPGWLPRLSGRHDHEAIRGGLRFVAFGSLATTVIAERLGKQTLTAGTRLPLMLCLAGSTALDERPDSRPPWPLLIGLTLSSAGDTVLAGSNRKAGTLTGIGLFAAGVAAWATESRCGLGATLLIASDLLIALHWAGPRFPGQHVLIYGSYLAGQYLIARHGAAAMSRPDRPHRLAT